MFSLALLLAGTLPGLHAASPAFAGPGDPDGGFGTQGVALADIGDEGVLGMAIEPGGKILTATLADAASDRASLRITRFTAAGQVDSSFGSAGVATTTVDVDSLSTVRAMLRQAGDGKLVVAGRSLSSFALTRLSSAGALDAGFGTGGTARTTLAGDDEVLALAQQPADNRIVAVGRADDGLDSDFAIARYTTAGLPDNTFSGDGKATIELGGTDVARAVAIHSDGSIVIAGSSEGSSSDIAVVRLTSTGNPDPGFGSGGKVTTSVTPRDDVAYAVLVQSDGKVVVAGEADDDFVLVRYTNTGQPDPDFGNGGIARTNVSPGAIDFARAVVRQSDDKLVAAGQANPARGGDFALVRYTTGGQPDGTFGNSGVVTTSVAAGFDEELTSLLLQADGMLLAAGLSEDGSTSYQMLARYQASGVASVCGDADGNGSVQASDALRVLRNSVGQPVTCPASRCDVDSNGSVLASDALRVLRNAVGQAVTLSCPP